MSRDDALRKVIGDYCGLAAHLGKNLSHYDMELAVSEINKLFHDDYILLVSILGKAYRGDSKVIDALLEERLNLSQLRYDDVAVENAPAAQLEGSDGK